MIWQMLGRNEIAAYNVPSGIMFDMHREAAAKRPGVLTKVGLDTFVDPRREGCAMNEAAAAQPIVKVVEFEGEEWLYFPAIAPDVAIIRATTADERGNLTFEQEGAYLGALDLAMAAHNTGGKVIAQVKRVAEAGTLRTHDVRVPGILVDYVVEAPEQWQTTQTPYDPAISGEIFRPMSSFALMEWGIGKPIARRVAQEIKKGWAVNLGFGVSANVPRIFIEEGLHGEATWVIEQGAVGGVPLLDFQFGCSSNAEAIVPSPHQFTYFQASGFDCSLLSFLQIDSHGSVNVSKLGVRPHVTAGAGGFVDITVAGEEDRVFGLLQCRRQDADRRRQARHRPGGQGEEAGARGRACFVFRAARRRARPGCDLCDRALRDEARAGRDRRDGDRAGRRSSSAMFLAQAEFPLMVSPNLKVMEAALFRPEPFGLTLDG